MNFSEKINHLFKRERWVEARRLLEQRLQAEPKNHWLLTRLGTTYYEKGAYRKALELSEQAYKLAPKCPLVLWDLASTQEMLGDDSRAVKVYKDLFELRLEEASAEECSEGVQWLRSLLSDCFYSVAGCLFRLSVHDMALWFIQQHVEWRMRGARSIYSLKDARALMRDIVRAFPRDVFQEGVGEAGRRLARV